MNRLLRQLILLSVLLLFSVTLSQAAALRAYKGADGRIHYTDRHALPTDTYSLFDESTMADQPLIDVQPDSSALKKRANYRQASLAKKSVRRHPVQKALISTSRPAVLFDEGVELYKGQVYRKPSQRDKAASIGPQAQSLDELIRYYSRLVGLKPALVKAVAKVESNLNPRALSPKGAQGLMQLMPATARELGVDDPYDPEQSIYGGCLYLKMQLERFGGDLNRALAAYNAGPGAVEKYNGIPPYRETRAYVRKVKRAIRKYARI